MAGVTMLKLTSLTSLTDTSAARLTRMRAVVVAGPVTVQAKLPMAAPAGTAAAIALHVIPPSRLTSMFTVSPLFRLCAQVIGCTLPTGQPTFVLGDVTVTGSTIVKLTSLTSKTDGSSALLARTRPCVVVGPVTVHR